MGGPHAHPAYCVGARDLNLEPHPRIALLYPVSHLPTLRCYSLSVKHSLGITAIGVGYPNILDNSRLATFSANRVGHQTISKIRPLPAASAQPCLILPQLQAVPTSAGVYNIGGVLTEGGTQCEASP